MKQTTKLKETEIGMIPEDWEVKPAEEFCPRVTDGTHYSPKPQSNGKYLITSRHLKDGRLDFENAYYISEEDFTEVNRRSKVDQWDVIFSMIGTIGETYLEKSNVLNYAIKNVGLFKSGGNRSIGKWIFYYMKSNFAKEYIHRNKAGTTQEYMTLESLRQFPILSPIHTIEMKNIVHILDSLQDKIELNHQMNKTLEAIGQALFKHWFVDFEFPNVQGKPYKSSGGEMVDSELGEIPKGWKIEKLGNFIRVERGLSYKGSGLCKKGIPLINLGNIAPNNNFKYEGLKFYSGDYKERNLVKPCDLIIANTDITQKREVLGSCLIVPSDLGCDILLFTHHIYAIRPLKDKDALPKHFLSYLLQTSEYRERTSGFATGTTVLALPEDAILEFNFIMPNRKILQEFDILLTFIKEKSSKNIEESKNLSQIRDSLLPKLMSGKIRVPTEARA